MADAMADAQDFTAFAAGATELEARIADAEARGEPVPAEARAMLAALRDLARAVEGLRSTLDASPEDGAAPAPDAPAGDRPPG